jgi:transcriptional regulator with XRE-family HTH domain
MNLDEAVGIRIRTARTRSNIPQGKLAEKLGVSNASIAKIEGGKQSIYLHTLFDIAKALEINVYELIPDNSEIFEEELIRQELLSKNISAESVNEIMKDIGER